MSLLSLQHGLHVRELGFQLAVLGRLDDLGRVADDGAEEFLLGDLFEVGEAELGEEFLRFSSSSAWGCYLVSEFGSSDILAPFLNNERGRGGRAGCADFVVAQVGLEGSGRRILEGG